MLLSSSFCCLTSCPDQFKMSFFPKDYELTLQFLPWCINLVPELAILGIFWRTVAYQWGGGGDGRAGFSNLRLQSIAHFLSSRLFEFDYHQVVLVVTVSEMGLFSRIPNGFQNIMHLSDVLCVFTDKSGLFETQIWIKDVIKHFTQRKSGKFTVHRGMQVISSLSLVTSLLDSSGDQQFLRLVVWISYVK